MESSPVARNITAVAGVNWQTVYKNPERGSGAS